MQLGIAVLATVIGGVVVSLMLSMLDGPNVKLVENSIRNDTDGYSILAIALHNDGSENMGNCTVALEGQYANGDRTASYLGSDDGPFYLPAHSDATYRDSARDATLSPIIFRIKRVDAPGGRTYIVLYCTGYRKEFLIEKNKVPSR